MKYLLLIPVLAAAACSSTANIQAPQGQAREAVLTRVHHDMLIDSDPVAAREASYGEVSFVRSKGPYVDRLPEQHDPATRAPARAFDSKVDLSFDAADADPVSSRGWR